MAEMSPHAEEAFQIHPIGAVRRTGEGIRLEIDEPFRPALKQLDQFSHVVVLWWADRLEAEVCKILQCRPPYAEEHLTGVFATRAPYRPNPVAMTTCRLLDVDEDGGQIAVADIDAHDASPILDLKAYFPVCDRVQEARIPEWLSDWPQWMPKDGLGLEPWEE
jgi:tRNA-Thr(GGU) m(6)t(6)A37 methyltransferase TsaA